MFNSKGGLSRTVSEINGDFNRQFSHPRVFIAPLKGLAIELDISTIGHKTRMMGLPEGRKGFKIGLGLLVQYRRVPSICCLVFWGGSKFRRR